MNKHEVSSLKIVDGMLQIDRGNGLMPQTCPYRGAPCGQWCPLFGSVAVVPHGRMPRDIKTLTICNATIQCVYKED
jgi:hypothetical protein